MSVTVGTITLSLTGEVGVTKTAIAAVPADCSLPAANTAAVVTYAASPTASHVISGVAWSYDQTPAGGNIKVEDGAGNVIFSIDVPTAGAGVVYFWPGKQGTINTALVVTLSAGGVGVTGKLDVIGHWTV